MSETVPAVTDKNLAANVRNAITALNQTIRAARMSGLVVDLTWNSSISTYDGATITRPL